MRTNISTPWIRSFCALAVLSGCGRLALAAAPTAESKPAAAAAKAAGTAVAELATKKSLTLEAAHSAIAAAVAKAKSLQTTGVIAVVDDGGNLMAVERLDGTFSAGANISIGKARTAALFKKPTRAFEEIIKNGRTPMIALSDFTPLVGGIPLFSAGQLVGGIGVSGAASADQDEELALAGAAALASSAVDRANLAALVPASAANQPASPVAFFGRDQVAAAFEKGQPLLETGAYKIHASRREAEGSAEVHTDEADIAYVQEGHATLVTGGALVHARTLEPHELRGDGISGGEQRQLSRGDVVVIPKGVPHWFRNVSKPFTYYVVKVRT